MDYYIDHNRALSGGVFGREKWGKCVNCHIVHTRSIKLSAVVWKHVGEGGEDISMSPSCPDKTLHKYEYDYEQHIGNLTNLLTMLNILFSNIW